MEEKDIAFSLFGECINKHVLPPFNEITSKIRNTILKNRSSAAVKTWLHNQIRKRKAQDISPKSRKNVMDKYRKIKDKN